MKKLILSSAVLLVSLAVLAQAPQTIPYQAVARDASGNLLQNTSICVQFRVFDAATAGNLLYEEHQSATTNKFGLFTLSVGAGNYDGGSSSTLGGVNWGGTPAYLEVALNTSGTCSGYTTMGRSQMLSVPFALYAASGGTAQVNSNWNATSGVAEILNKPTLATVATSGSYTDLSNKPTIPVFPPSGGTSSQYINGAGSLVTFPTIPAAQVNSDWNATSGVAQILNKPAIPVFPPAGGTSSQYINGAGSLVTFPTIPVFPPAGGTSSQYINGAGALVTFPSIPAAQVNSDWNATGGVAQILNKPTSLPPNGSAGGDLSGSYPGPTVAGIQGKPVTLSSLADGNLLQYSSAGSDWVNVAPSSLSAGSVANPLTISTTGNGSGTSYNGGSGVTISYNTVGAAPATGSGNYIQNQNSAVQTAPSLFWISGDGRSNTSFTTPLVQSSGGNNLNVTAASDLIMGSNGGTERMRLYTNGSARISNVSTLSSPNPGLEIDMTNGSQATAIGLQVHNFPSGGTNARTGIAVDMTNTKSSTGIALTNIGSSSMNGITIDADANGDGTGIRLGATNTLNTGIVINGGTGITYNAHSSGSGTALNIGGTTTPNVGVNAQVSGSGGYGGIFQSTSAGAGLFGLSITGAYSAPSQIPIVGTRGYAASNGSGDVTYGVYGSSEQGTGGNGNAGNIGYGVYGLGTANGSSNNGFAIGVYGQATEAGNGTRGAIGGYFITQNGSHYLSLAASGGDVYLGSTDANRPSNFTGSASSVMTVGSGNTNTVYMYNSNISGTTTYYGSGSSSAGVGITAPATVTGAYTITLPTGAATAAGQVLSSTGANGTLQWSSPAAGTVTSVTAASNGGLATSPAGGITTTGSISANVDNSTIKINGSNQLYVAAAPSGGVSCGTVSNPGSISGNATVCSGSSYTYSVAAVAGASNYTWAVPAGYTITSGWGTNSITVAVGSSTGSISVVANNNCGQPSTASTFNITTVNSSPATPAFSGTAPSTSVTLGAAPAYSINSISGCTYNFSFPNGWTGGGATASTSITPTTPANGQANSYLYGGTQTINIYAINSTTLCQSAPLTQTITVHGKAVYAYTGSNQTFVVPTGITALGSTANGASGVVELWGAGGAGAAHSSSSYAIGGGGGYVSGAITNSTYATAGNTLTIIVGQGGIINGGGGASGTAYGGGGGGGYNSGTTYQGGGGGGRSAIQFSGSDIVTAGGGGGACANYSSSANNGSGGGGGGATGQAGAAGISGGAPGTGGAQTATTNQGCYSGCCGGNGTSGTGGAGGSNSGGYEGGGGGGGYFGGGGGSCNDEAAGGGGSSYVGGLATSSPTPNNTQGTGQSTNNAPCPPGNTTSGNYATGIGTGGNYSSGPVAGGNGLVVIPW